MCHEGLGRIALQSAKVSRLFPMQETNFKKCNNWSKNAIDYTRSTSTWNKKKYHPPVNSSGRVRGNLTNSEFGEHEMSNGGRATLSKHLESCDSDHFNFSSSACFWLSFAQHPCDRSATTSRALAPPWRSTIPAASGARIASTWDFGKQSSWKTTEPQFKSSRFVLEARRRWQTYNCKLGT